MFPNSNKIRNSNPLNFNFFNRRTPELIDIYALPLPESSASRKHRNAVKRTAELFQFQFPVPGDDSNNFKGKKRRYNEDVFPNRRNRKQGPAKKAHTFPSQEHILKKVLDYADTSKIFSSSLLKYEPIDSNLNTSQFDYSDFIKNFPLPKLDNNFTNIDNEIRQIVDSVSLPEPAYQAIWNKICNDLNEVFVIEGCTNKWNLFGSYLYGLVNKDSDIDIYYQCVQNDPAASIPESIPANMRKKLFKSKKFCRISYIKNARVPLLKALHYETKIQIDISFSHDLGVRNSLLTKLYLKINPDLKYLTLYLKEILRKYHTLGTGKITTHILFWLASFFMQQKKLLPAVIDVRKSSTTRYEAAGWDCSLPEDYSYPVEPVSLYSLLVEFFAFYKNFDFLNYVICPFVGRALLLSDFEQLRISADEFSVYLNRLKNPEQSSFSRCVMNLQDPCDLGFNLAKQVTVQNANKFKIICDYVSTSLPISGEVMSINEVLPKFINFDSYESYKLGQYGHFVMQLSSLAGHCVGLMNNDYLLEAMRKVMEKVFDFEIMNISIAPNLPHIYFNDGKLSKNTASVIYFEYRSSENTWKNDFIKDIISRKEDEKEQIKVFITSELCVERNLIRFFFQSQVNFVRFLHQHAAQLLSVALKEIIPNP